MTTRSRTLPRRDARRIFAALLTAGALIVVALNWTWGRLPAEPRPTGTVAEVAGLRVRHLERAGAGTPVLLIHGLPGTAEDFGAVTRRLPGRRTIAVDRPGYGFSSGGYVPFDRQVTVLSRLLRQLDAPRAIVVGHSYGGTIALGLAERHPEQVAGLVLADTAAAGFRAGAAERLRSRAVRLLGVPAIGELTSATFSQLLRTAAAEQGDREAFAPAPVAAAHLQRLKAMNMRGEDLAALFGEQLGLNRVIEQVDDELRSIAAPAVVIQADGDRLVAPVHGRRLAASLGDARLVMVRGGHMTPYTHPQVIAAAISRLG